MKKSWKIIVGAVFLVGGFGNIGSDMGAAILGVVVGIALIAWWTVGRKKASDKQETIASTPTAPPKPKPAKRPSFPYEKDGAPEAYRYRIKFAPSAPDVVSRAIQDEQWYLSARIEAGKVHLFLDGNDLGLLPERTNMMTDWLNRGDPYMAAIEEDTSAPDYVVTLVFYRDKQKYYANREQTIVALTGYKSEGKQYTISILEEGEELEAEEDTEKEDRVFIVSRFGDQIGSLPKKYALRVLDEKPALIVFDHDEPIKDSDEVKPYVKIYW